MFHQNQIAVKHPYAPHHPFTFVRGALVLVATACFAMSIQAQYVSSTAEQVSAGMMTPGTVNNPVIRVRIEVGPNPIELFALFLSTAGTTDPAMDIDSIKIYYTSGSTIFTTATPFTGTTFPMPSGTNYFWVTYDISPNATLCDTIDAECTTVYATGGTHTPTVTTPPGYAVIGSCMTGTEPSEMSIQEVRIFPNPSNGRITILVADGTVEVFNTLGMVVYADRSIVTGNEIDLSNAPKGAYVVKVHLGSAIQTCVVQFLYP